MQIKSLAYIGIAMPDPAKWLDYGVNVLGMMPARCAPGEPWAPPRTDGKISEVLHTGTSRDGSVYLKLDERQWRIAVHPDDRDSGLQYIGLELDGQAEFETAVAELQERGVAVEVGSPQDAFRRAATGLARLKDPSGFALELIHGPTLDYQFDSPVADHRFVAGPLGFGHLNLFVKNQAECFDFYTRVLGFKLTDYIRFGPETVLQFMRCNARHHSIAIVEMGPVTGLQHLMIEVSSADDVGRALDRAARAGCQITTSLGRHRNDGVLSFYMRSPSAFDVEIACEGRLIDESWTVNEFCEGDVWGHVGMLEAIMQSTHNLAGAKRAPE